MVKVLKYLELIRNKPRLEGVSHHMFVTSHVTCPVHGLSPGVEADMTNNGK